MEDFLEDFLEIFLDNFLQKLFEQFFEKVLEKIWKKLLGKFPKKILWKKSQSAFRISLENAFGKIIRIFLWKELSRVSLERSDF